MNPEHFLLGMGIGFSIAAPVGPVGLLCIQRTLSGGMPLGLVSGLGAASADTFYGYIAAFGLHAASRFLLAQAPWLQWVGGGFLCLLGVKILLGKPSRSSANPEPRGLAMAYLSAFLLTLANPLTILAFAAIFAGLGLGAPKAGMAPLILVAGVFSGSACWWLLLSGLAGRLRERLNDHWLLRIHHISGAVIIAAGIVSLAVAAWD